MHPSPRSEHNPRFPHSRDDCLALTCDPMKGLQLLLATALVAASLCLVQADPPNGISAVVHDAVITFDEVDFATAQTAEVLSRQFQSKPEQFQKKMTEARSDNLDKLLSRQLILH